MTPEHARLLLQQFRQDQIDLDSVLRQFQAAPLVDLGFAQVDTHRALRKGFPEVIFGSGKDPEHLVAIATRILEADQQLLVTRVSEEQRRALQDRFPTATHHPAARCLTIINQPLPKRPGFIAVLAAGTSDFPVAEEAALTADTMGNHVQRIYDVGVAGLHRLLGQLERIQRANVLVVVAGMEGALPSVVACLVNRPVIAVPTSIGYGANLGGLAALLGMLTSCGSGVTVTNIDNGFGGGYAASQINALAADSSQTP
jgi:pyridinium-3,5-biscarboxylic acid mononucleotide synthase